MKQKRIMFLSQKLPEKCPLSFNSEKVSIQNCEQCLLRIPHQDSIRWLATIHEYAGIVQKFIENFYNAVFCAAVTSQFLWNSAQTLHRFNKISCYNFRIVVCIRNPQPDDHSGKPIDTAMDTQPVGLQFAKWWLF